MVMIDKITETTIEELISTSLRTATPIFEDPNYKLKQHSFKHVEYEKYNTYLELLVNSVCSDVTLSIQSEISLKEIWQLNKTLSNHLLRIEYQVCNDNGCDSFGFYTLNKDLYDRYKDVETIHY